MTVALASLCVLLLPAAAPAAVLRAGLRVDLGPEFDSNANRVEVRPDVPGEEPVPSGLLRLELRGSFRLRAADAHVLDLSLLGGGKLFFSEAARGADVLVQQVAAIYRYRTPLPLTLGATADYYQVFQHDSPTAHDFLTFGGAATLALLGPSESYLALSSGYRQFDDHYRINSFRGPAASLVVGARFYRGKPDDEVEWDVEASYYIHLRSYDDNVLVPCAPGDNCSAEQRLFGRADLFHALSLGATYVGRLLVGLAYGLQLNDSNSAGFSIIRHSVTARLAAPLPWRLYLAFKTTLQFSQLGSVLEPSSTVEDENRNLLIVELSRELSRHLSLSLRYSFYSNLFSGLPEQFNRHLLFLGVSFTLGR